MCEIISINSSRPQSLSTQDQSKFFCRFLKSEESSVKSLMRVSVNATELFQRGMSYSEYKQIYENHMASLTENIGINPQAAAANSDIYSQAIKQLHISVLPERLPCRNSEREAIERAIRRATLSRGSGKPLYVSGMPG